MVKKRKGTKSKKKRTILEETERRIRAVGIVDTDKPKDSTAQMPIDPTRLPPKRLQRAYTAMVAWYAYANDHLAKTRIQLIGAQRSLRTARARIRFASGGKKKYEQDAEMDLDPKIQKLVRRCEELEAMKIALETRVDNYDRKSKALSRDQSRRSVEYERSSRA